MKRDEKWKCEKKKIPEVFWNIPEDLQFFQDFYDRWIAEQIKEAKKMRIRKASEGYEL